MKKIVFILILSFLFIKCGIVHADNFVVSIHFTEGEKSKDSWSSETSISIIGNTLSYSKTYSGSIKNRKKTVDKTCTLTNLQVAEIQKLIKDGNLLISDSIEDKDSKYKSFEHFVNISADIIMEEKVSKIRINGDVQSIEDKELYKSCYKVISLVEEYVDKCE